jgi:transcriptional regulator with XRE-family HTH domain
VNTSYQITLEKIASVVLNRRKELNITQEDLADAAEIDRTYVSLIERAKVNPSLGVLCRVAEALDISLAQLLGAVEIPATVN